MSGAGYGQADPADGNSQFNRTAFLVRQAMALLRTASLVKVTAVTSHGDLAPAVFVDVQPLVNMVDGQGNTSQHGTIHGLPYFRLQGADGGFICDPGVGDIGLAVICDRDISSAKANRDVASPGSWRQHDLADGFYIGGWPGIAPTQYVRFFPDGINIADKNGNLVEMSSTGIEFTTLKMTVNGDLEVTGETKLAGTKKVALDGDPVVGGVVQASSTKVTAI